MTILKEYVGALLDGADAYTEAEEYYDGRVSERFSIRNAQLRRVLATTGHRAQHNYIKVIVDAVLNRLQINNVVHPDDKVQELITTTWRNNELDLESHDIHRKALEFGDCYVMVWPDEDGAIQISANSPRTTVLVYDPENPRKKLYAVKMWRVDDTQHVAAGGKTRMNVYTADAIHKYVTDATEITESSNWTAIGSEENPFGEVPVFHFRTHRPCGIPEGRSAFGVQNDINKLVATHMYTVDYQGAPQRYAMAANSDGDVIDFGDDETERENVSSLSNGPGELWYLKGITGVGQFNPADPDVFWKPIKSLKESMAALTDTPMHFFERSLNVPSGEALRVAESPLQKKVRDRQVSFGATWREVFMFILKIEGIVEGRDRLEVKWDTVESMDTLDEWDVTLKKINAGLSHRQALRERGYEEKDIDRIMKERDDEAKAGAFYQRKPDARVSTDDNETFENRNGLTEGAKENGGRAE